jgi:hypothetical protein
VIDDLACGILLGTSFLKPCRLNIIIWGPPGEADYLDCQGRNVFLTTDLRDPTRSKALLYAMESVTILPGQGINIPVIDHCLNCLLVI